ncbi:protein kinase domain-containing protein [Streptomyces sp. NPDC002144]
MGRREAAVPDGPLRDFAQGLRDLRAQAPGTPTYRTLAARARYSPSALSDAASGRRLPSWDVTAAFVAACGGDVEQWRERWRELDARLRSDHPALLPQADPGQDPAVDRALDEDVEADHDGQDAEENSDLEQDADGDTASAAEPAAAVSPLSPSDPPKAGPYRLLGRLGAGSMGVVYLGISRAGRPLAVKLVRADLAEDAHFRQRFAAEVAAARRVSGPFTAAVVDADTDTDRPWLATTYLPGPSVQEAVETGGPLPEAVVLGLAAGIAEALSSIHGAGVLHRDLTPGNVLLDTDGPKVIDFGVAQAVDASRLTKTGVRVGTVPFMAPEQADGREVTAASDVFALGCVLAYAATGVAPFGDGSSGEVLYRIAHCDPDPAAVDCSDDRLRDLIKSCLAKDPDRRPTPDEVLEACGADRSQDVAWLPTAAAARLAARRDHVSETLARAATRRTVVRVKLTAVPLILTTAIALAVALTAAHHKTSELTSPPDSAAPTTSAATASGPSPSPSNRSARPKPSRSQATAASGSGQGAAGIGTGTPGPSASRTTGGSTTAGGGTGSRAGSATWTGWSGTECASSSAAQTSFYPATGAWKTTTGGAYTHGCEAAKYIHLEDDGDGGWDANADWVFTPGTSVSSCSFRIHVAKGTWASHDAQYKVYNVDSTNYGQAKYFAHFGFDQHDYDAGGWYTTSSFTFHTGTIDLALTDTGSDSHGVVADEVEATCS